MRCCICHRPLTKPAATIQARGGAMLFGPDCARKAGLTVQATRKRIVLFTVRPRRAKRHADQMELQLEVIA